MRLKTNLRSVHFKKSYSSDFDDILRDFYIPTLESSVEYNRLAGFFSSTSLALAARGIIGLIKNDGFIKLLVSPKLNKDDLEIILNSRKDPNEFIEVKMIQELERLEDEFVRDHVFALGWMIANKKLEIKVAVPYDSKDRILNSEEIQYSGLFHQKVGILKDSEGNEVSFSGSINETASAWLENIEEFKVFCSWIQPEENYVKADISKFDRFWNNQSQRVKVMNVPQAVERKLIEIAPKNIEKIHLKRWYELKKKKIKLYHHQKDAIESWVENGMNGLFEMATGTGKTFAALGCLDRASKGTRKLSVVISSPYQHLVQQWKREINNFGIEFDNFLIADSSNPQWKTKLANILIDISLGYKDKLIVLTTHKTCSSDVFMKILRANKSQFSIFLIADEIHGLGAERFKEGLLSEYDKRLGLSATPKRWFDAIGTEKIYNYFGGVVYEFGLEKAINTINPVTNETYLTPFTYKPKFISLTEEELENYINKTKTIAMKFSEAKLNKYRDKFLENLLFERANIVKNAKEKYMKLEGILDQLKSPIKWTIIYCSPQQIVNVLRIIKKRRIIAHRFTMHEGTKPDKKYDGLSQRDFILRKLAEGDYQVLVAMKCLDEGVDIPPARVAILLASSGNPREYIQRIGRVIRRFPGKKSANIYDIILTPSLNKLPLELRNIESKIFEKELKRYKEIAMVAINNAEALKGIDNVIL